MCNNKWHMLHFIALQGSLDGPALAAQRPGIHEVHWAAVSSVVATSTVIAERDSLLISSPSHR